MVAVVLVLTGDDDSPVLPVTTGSSTDTSTTTDNRPWTVVWNEEFNGDAVSSPDGNDRHDDYLPYEESILTANPQNVKVADGVLTIQAQRERATVGKTTRQFTSGYLDTIGKHSWRYGRFEMRAKLPLSTGMWPAFWLRGDNGPGEIDILEAVGGMPRFTHQAVHQSTNGGQGRFQNDFELPSSTVDQWHVYAAEVEPDRITWQIDGTTVFTVTSDQAPWLRETFDEPLNIRLNLQVGGSFPKYYNHPVTESTEFPAKYTIDWIRVSQRT